MNESDTIYAVTLTHLGDDGEQSNTTAFIVGRRRADIFIDTASWDPTCIEASHREASDDQLIGLVDVTRRMAVRQINLNSGEDTTDGEGTR